MKTTLVQSSARHRLKVGAFIALAVVVLAAVFRHPPIPQPQDYYDFADKRAWLGIPNFGDVISNVLFLWTGVGGLRFLADRAKSAAAFATPAERAPYIVFFLGVLGTAFGSGWFHLNPNNTTLVPDRLPLTIAFMGFFCAMIGERIGLLAARRLLWPLVATGIASVGYWYWSETAGRGDMRLYLLVQFFPMLAVPLLLALFPPRYSGGGWIAACLSLYALAKGLELADRPVLAALGISGHTLKHLAGGIATWTILRMLRTRRSLIVSS